MINESDFEIEIDETKVDKIMRKIILREQSNARTKQYNDGEMSAMVKKLIEEEIKCY